MSSSSKSIFDIFGEACAAEMSDTERAGRYSEQAEGERAAILDVIEKLKISPSDSLLEIGSGPGNLYNSYFLPRCSGNCYG